MARKSKKRRSSSRGLPGNPPTPSGAIPRRLSNSLSKSKRLGRKVKPSVPKTGRGVPTKFNR